MFVQKETQHKHAFKKAYKKDSPISEQDAIKHKNYDKGPRWVKFWVCACGYREAYDLAHEEPQ